MDNSATLNGGLRLVLLKLIGQRLLAGVVMLLVVSLLIFAGIQLLPGSAATAILGQTATPQAVAALNQQLGLDQPAMQRYLSWLAGVLQGDFGHSFTTREAIGPVLLERLGNSLSLAFFTALVAVPLSLAIGFLCARYQGRWPDRVLSLFTRTAVSLPEFFSGYLLILVFSITLFWLPSNGSISEGMPFGQRLLAIALPCLTLILAVLGHMSNMTRAALVNAQNAAYVDTALMKGLSSSAILFRHVLPNAWGPIINVIVLNLAYLMVGVVIVENVFVYPGLGQYMVDSISKRDIPVIQDCALLLAAIYILLNLLADVVALVANPRLLHGR
ncbi:peptide/nickel transport system permease protein [Gibbsiella quercinecans]|uniref:ABC transporter permease n=2 Tax=Gibbsiella quercinecans TaxID=929813 RepID=A0A250AYC3_9GAMM|nr:ABC transporter permease [Gibbsiella quercinecans]ATA18904.1 ABC transporter permease [Gibbsiella quercinecans]RLM12118.1 ABC transporter permease [Gibbsiella quercinecans]RLM15153.1 ABC transporter permease [Gibbsiella quercinecans]TCT91552.1 peptide/nickel transport system permease protein [Gibbsiella quercinecans]